jgi:peptidoglycan/xylan/chitin deacetylase (PgdA/CDA1 family)
VSLQSALAFLTGRPRGVPILMYHYVGDAPAPEDRPYFVSSSAFAEQMELLAGRGYRTLSLDELLAAFGGTAELPSRAIVLTFDDGHESFEGLAVPILRKHGFTATMFVITSKIGADGFLGADAIRSLSAGGFEFGSHSHTHPILTKLADEEVAHELTTSKTLLESVIAREVKHFCYRGGHFDDRVKALVAGSGYSGAVCSKPGLNTLETDRLELRRMGIRGADDLASFGRKVQGRT